MFTLALIIFFVDKALLSSVGLTEYSAIVISDHAPLVLELSLSPSPRCGPWRFNTGLLATKTFCEHISKQIDFFIDNNKSESTSPSLLWETFKAVMRGEIISYNAHSRKQKTKEQQDLVDAISKLDRQYSSSPTPELYAERRKLQSKFDLLSTGRAEYLLRRTRGTYYEYGDKASRLLASQLKHQSASQFITQVYDSSHSLTTNPTEINDAFTTFYSKLYTSEPPIDNTNIEHFFDSLDISNIDTLTRDSLDDPLSLEEITGSLRKMQNNKAPGPDGFPVDFYKKFSAQLAPLLLDMFNDSLKNGTLPPTLRQASISLILKKGKKAEDCSSWRPISLLNADVKLLAKVLANRLDPCLPGIVSIDQTGFIRGRQLSSNIRRLLNIVLSPAVSPDAEMIVSLDAEKAFDRVEWDYLFFTLHKFGFGSRFVSWIRLLYTNPTASVKTNSQLSKFFPLTRGTRQGCPISPLLFALAIEPLAIALRSSPLFTGMRRAGLDHRVSLYADDLLLYISDPVNCIGDILQLLNSFGSFSGYKVNFDKSECFPVNEVATRIPAHALPFHLAPTSFRYLGVTITRSLASLHETNFSKLVTDIKADLQRWGTLPLSLFGRIQTIKMNILPRFLFLFQCLPIFFYQNSFSIS